MSNIYLETERIILREMKPSEANLLFTLDSDPAVMKYLSGGKTTEMEECKKAILRICEYPITFHKSLILKSSIFYPKGE